MVVGVEVDLCPSSSPNIACRARDAMLGARTSRLLAMLFAASYLGGGAQLWRS